MKSPNDEKYVNLIEVVMLIDRILFHDFDEAQEEAVAT